MTIREFYDKTLIELNKVEAPSLLLEDFNYFANKAVQQYTNKIYNRYDTTQQTTDDLSALKSTTRLTVEKDNDGESAPKESKTYYCQLPTNYLHLLNCIVEFTGGGVGMCKSETKKQSMARRLTSDMYPSIISNAYFKPSYRCPYYFINNTNKALVDDYESKLKLILNPKADDVNENGKPLNPDFYDNLRMEIRCGDTRVWIPTSVYIDYIKTPDRIELTWDQLNEIEDTTSKLEFPEYVCYEIINEFTKLVLENYGDPRLETHIPVNQTIAGVSNNN